jgi:hypothetical protein
VLSDGAKKLDNREVLTRNQSRATALDLAAVWRRMSPAVGPDAMVEGKQELRKPV